MSGIKKAGKKIFRGAKKVIKKIAKPALIIGGAFFASGLALGGFSGFGQLMNNSGIFGAVGKTMAAGAQAIGGALGLTEGVSSELLGQMGLEEGTTLGSGALANTLGFGTPSAPSARVGAGNLDQSLRASTYAKDSVLKEVTKESAKRTGFLGRVFGSIGKLSDPAQMALFQGVSTGIQAYAQSEEAKKERKRQRKLPIFGVPLGAEFGTGITQEQINQIRPARFVFSDAARSRMAPSQPAPQPPQQGGQSGGLPQPQPQTYANPYTTAPPPPPSAGPLLG